MLGHDHTRNHVFCRRLGSTIYLTTGQNNKVVIPLSSFSYQDAVLSCSFIQQDQRKNRPDSQTFSLTEGTLRWEDFLGRVVGWVTLRLKPVIVGSEMVDLGLYELIEKTQYGPKIRKKKKGITQVLFNVKTLKTSLRSTLSHCQLNIFRHNRVNLLITRTVYPFCLLELCESQIKSSSFLRYFQSLSNTRLGDYLKVRLGRTDTTQRRVLLEKSKIYSKGITETV